MNYTFPIIMAILGSGSLIIAILMYIMNKSQLNKLETNHFAHLEVEVRNNKEDITNLRKNITEIYNKISELAEDLAFIKGKLNGSIK